VSAHFSVLVACISSALCSFPVSAQSGMLTACFFFWNCVMAPLYVIQCIVTNRSAIHAFPVSAQSGMLIACFYFAHPLLSSNVCKAASCRSTSKAPTTWTGRTWPGTSCLGYPPKRSQSINTFVITKQSFRRDIHANARTAPLNGYFRWEDWIFGRKVNCLLLLAW